MLEGPRALDGALASGAHVEAVFVRADRLDAALFGRGWHRYDGPVYEITADELTDAADAVNPQGVIATVRQDESSLEAVARLARVVLLDQLRNPGNVGAIVRTAVAAGFDAVVATAGTADIFGPKSLRAAAGLTSAVAVVRDVDAATALEHLGAEGHLRVRAAVDGDVELAGLMPPERVTLVVGNEAVGPSAATVEGTDAAVRIPMREPVDSLNVGVAAGVLMYALRPPDRASGH